MQPYAVLSRSTSVAQAGSPSSEAADTMLACTAAAGSAITAIGGLTMTVASTDAPSSTSTVPLPNISLTLCPLMVAAGCAKDVAGR